ncbi:DUF2252 domain-containing protein [Streptomyces sp. NRRL B-24484]|uniref:DUF2252 domain-containing protein n=1 Tax=Streptomyces sp. NRRL B-24484 TaxID=1463833 RepID=UPI0005BDFDF1|nr:DUF2252 family protein [Streptomyces sp. NRRL B-24484]
MPESVTATATATEGTERGRAVRSMVPRSSHGTRPEPAGRADPVALLERRAVNLLPQSVPVRHARMAASPFAFLRGAAAVMAADLAVQPHTGLTVQLCGDAHLLNFGLYGPPQGAPVFGLGDFDETLPGPFEWDVKRLAVSVAIAAHAIGGGPSLARGAARSCVRAYREAVRRPAGSSDRSGWPDTAAGLPAGWRRDGVLAAARLTELRGRRRRIVPRLPLITSVPERVADGVHAVLEGYRASLPERRRELLDGFRFVDAAAVVAGVGGVGTCCFAVLLQGRTSDDLLVLQLKEAGRSALEDHLPSGPHDHHGHRVVAGQRLLQAVDDDFLGWTTGPGVPSRQFYWRQLRDPGRPARVEAMTPRVLQRYGALCGAALARAHARSGDRPAIAGYLGSGTVFDEAVADFAVRYAERNAADHARLCEAIAAGAVGARADA